MSAKQPLTGAPAALVEYDSAARRPPMLEELIELVRYRDLVVQLVWNSLKSRYTRSVLGVAWTLLNPLLTMSLMSLVFARVFHGDVEHYPIYVLSGLLVWSFFSQSIPAAMHNLVWSGSNLLRRVYLPRTLFTVVTVGAALANMLLGLVPLLVIFAFSGQRPTWALLFVPVAVALIGTFVLGAALFFSTIAVFFTDMIEIFQAAVTALFYLTPVIFPPTILPERYRFLVELNPLTSLIEIFRAPIHRGCLPDPRTLFLASLLALSSLLLGWWTFTRKADALVYRA
jgi:ABC-type polysaccharide/polyol phosphate export permease